MDRPSRINRKNASPLNLSIDKQPWNLPLQVSESLKAIVCINILHISPVHCLHALFNESSIYLGIGCNLFIYGPFKINGQNTSKSNQLFDETLRERNKRWGIRDLELVNEIAMNNNFLTGTVFSMPANNLLIVFNN